MLCSLSFLQNLKPRRERVLKAYDNEHIFILHDEFRGLKEQLSKPECAQLRNECGVNYLPSGGELFPYAWVQYKL